MNFAKNKLPAKLSALLLVLFLVACSDKPEALLISAKEYLAKNDNKAAVIQIKNALQSDPGMPEARYLLGKALLDDGDPVGAETELRKALDLKYAKDAVLPFLAKAMLSQGHARKVSDEFAGVELGQPQAKASLLMSLTSAYAMQGMTELSQSALHAALQADPGNAGALIEQARQSAMGGNFDAALTGLKSVIDKFPTSYEAWKLKGDVLWFAKKQVPESLAAYRKSLEIKPDFLPAHVGIIAVLMRQGQFAEADKQVNQLKKWAANHPQTKFIEAQLAYQRSDFKLAGELLQQVLNAAPENAQGLQLAGVVALQVNALVQAEKYLSKAVQTAPELLLARRALVVTYLRLSEPVRALETLTPGLALAGDDAELLSLAGEVYLQNGEVKQAEAYFLRASQRSPLDAKKRTQLALTRLRGGATESALAELQEIAISDPGTSADMALISASLHRHEYDKALKVIDGLEKKLPAKPLASQLRGVTLLAKNDVGGAKKSFERALTIDPKYFVAVASLASLDMQDKKPELAKKRFEAILVNNPKNGSALLALAELGIKTGASSDEVVSLLGKAIAANPDDVAPRLLLINFHLRNQGAKTAVSAAQNAVAALPNSPDLTDALGRAQQSLGEYNQAIASYQKLLLMQPRSALPHMRLAQVHWLEKNKEASVQSLRKALEIQPDYLEAQLALVMLDINSGKFEEALKTVHTIQIQRPDDVVGYAMEGDAYAAQKNWHSAKAAYVEGLKRQNSSELAIKLHAVLQASGKSSEADQFSSTWLKSQPKDALFLLYLGDLALARNDFSSAEKRYAAVVNLQANNAIAYNNLAWVSAKLNKESALAHAQKANALAPNQPVFMDTLAMLLSEKGDYEKALEIQNKALALQPENYSLKLNRVKIYIKGGNKEFARRELDELVKLGSAFSGQAEVASLLKTL